MRPEVLQVVTGTGPVVLVTGDTGTGKSSVLQSSTTEYPNAILASPVRANSEDKADMREVIHDLVEP